MYMYIVTLCMYSVCHNALIKTDLDTLLVLRLARALLSHNL